ncbi:unnamed protein product [Vitrella brassicaformis CCMP3155]|uniref:Uncharacterized protein n=1 Tax=Vitrella brassicaformis (strain CCMP3155) TaxID=1169540 RepID=A0A0G4G0V0_VITBC|nr:unnamed protein product [Vitrella brassicaformis CCMP3155]|eukprot:CEM21165.1 unnamed protein product [Vitrella brassicaformis CCMP3155]
MGALMGCPISDVDSEEWGEQFEMMHEAVESSKINDYIPYPVKSVYIRDPPDREALCACINKDDHTVKQECWEDFAKLCAVIGAKQVIEFRQLKVKDWGEAHVRAEGNSGARLPAPRPAEDGYIHLNINMPQTPYATPQDTATEPRSEVVTRLLASEPVHAASVRKGR